MQKTLKEYTLQLKESSYNPKESNLLDVFEASKANEKLFSIVYKEEEEEKTSENTQGEEIVTLSQN